MNDLPEAVHTLERELRGVFGPRLQSLVAYGRRVQAHGGPTRTMALVESLTALASSAARLEGRVDADVEGAGSHAERALGLAGGTITDVVRLVNVHEIPAADAERMFPTYLAAVERLVEYVDGWSH